jgi:hypothetical protein
MPTRSVLVVTKGCVATAGSIPIFLKNMGYNTPMVTAKSMEAHIEIPTTTPTMGEVWNNKNERRPSRFPYTKPSKSPTRISFRITGKR